MHRATKFTWYGLLIGLVSILLSSCAAGPPAKTGFLDDYSRLKPVPDVENRFRYINPSINPGDYSKFIVEPVAVNLSAKTRKLNIDEQTLDELAKHFHTKIIEELKKGYQVVQSAGPGVARVRAAITDIEKTNPLLNIHPGMKLMGGGLGGAGMEGEVVDSVSNVTIAAVINNQKGSRLGLTSGLTRFGHAKELMEEWAKNLKEWLDKNHGK